MLPPETTGRDTSLQHFAALALPAAGLIALALLVPQASLPVIFALTLLTLGLLFYERLRITRAMRELARRIRAGQLDTKLEVHSGAWGELCHAVNGLLQQQRRQQRFQSLLPELPPPVAEAVVAAQIPAEGLTRTIVVLACGPATMYRHDSARRLHALRQLAIYARRQAASQRALLERHGEMFLFVFGAFDNQDTPTALRSGLTVARELRALLPSDAETVAICFGLCSGPAHLALLPEMGCIISGNPLSHATRLQRLAAATTHDLACDEEIYISLRRLDSSVGSATRCSLEPDRHPEHFAYTLDL